MTKAKVADGLRGWGELNEDDKSSAYKLLQKGVSLRVVAESVGYRAQPLTLARRLREWSSENAKVARVGVNGNFEAQWDLYCQLIGRNPKRKVPTSTVKRPTKRRKVAVVCDLHGAPHEAVVKRLMEEPDVDLLAIDGDLSDNAAFSRFVDLPSTHQKPLTVSEEIANVRAFLELCSTRGWDIKINRGNHDDRVELYFATHVLPEFLPLCQWNLLELMAAGLKNVEIVHNVYDFTSGGGSVQKGALQSTWIIHLGDAVLGHAAIARKGEVRSVDGFAMWVKSWRRALGWPDPGLVLQAHVHRLGISYPDAAHEVRIEGGFAGDISQLQYSMDRGGRGTPPALGFVTFEQDWDRKLNMWMTDRKSVRPILC